MPDAGGVGCRPYRFAQKYLSKKISDYFFTNCGKNFLFKQNLKLLGIFISIYCIVDIFY